MYSGTLSYAHPVKVTPIFAGVLQKKICTSVVFKETLTNYYQ